MQFLNSIETESGQKASADLVFATYNNKTGLNVNIFDRLILNRQIVNLEPGVERVLLDQKVVICTEIDLVSFKTFTTEQGALGSLQLPIKLNDLTQLCLTANLITERRNHNV